MRMFCLCQIYHNSCEWICAAFKQGITLYTLIICSRQKIIFPTNSVSVNHVTPRLFDYRQLTFIFIRLFKSDSFGNFTFCLITHDIQGQMGKSYLIALWTPLTFTPRCVPHLFQKLYMLVFSFKIFFISFVHFSPSHNCYKIQ